MVKINISKTSGRLGSWHIVAGAIMTALGVYVWFNPAISLLALALYLGVAFILVGCGYLLYSSESPSIKYLLLALLDIFVGTIFVINLGVTAASLPIIFALWCLAVGIVQIAASYQLHRLRLPWSWSLGSGVIGVLFSFLILAYPVVGEITITAFMGAYIFIYGIIEIWEYLTYKDLKNTFGKIS